MSHRIGIYAGTFDPVHAGHIAFCLAAKRACNLDRIVLIPEETPRTKHNVTNVAHRQAMLELAIAGNPALQTSRLHTKQFTVRHTLPELCGMFAQAELSLLVGSDVVQHIHNWEDINTLLQKVSLVIGLRQDHTPDAITEKLCKAQAVCSTPIKYRFITTAYSHAASSHVRNGEQTTLLHPGVAAYITKNNLYTVGTIAKQ